MTQESAPKGAPQVVRTNTDDTGSAPSTNGHGTLDEPPSYLLPEDFWKARSIFGQIRQAAHSRTRSGDAVFHAVLARVAGSVDHILKLPPIVGAQAPLCYFVAIVGPPGSGKSSVNTIATELVPVGPEVLDARPIGSGEGLVDALFDMVPGDEIQKNGNAKLVKQQVYYNSIIFIDEGDALTALGGKMGSTTLSTLRSIWSGQPLGQTNANQDRRRFVPAGRYTYGLIMGLQPTLAGPLLDDAGAGTPQRFGWAWAIDPSIPDKRPDWPGQLRVPLPTKFDIEGMQQVPLEGLVSHQMQVAESVVEEIQKHDLAVSTGGVEIDPQEAHSLLLRLKVAGLLAILDRRLAVNEEDWALADIVTTVSGAVRRKVQTIVQVEATTKERQTSARLARREVEADDAKHLNRVDKAAHRIRLLVGRADGEALASEVRRVIGQTHRDVFEEAITYAVDRNWITEHTEPGQGEPKRILGTVNDNRG